MMSKGFTDEQCSTHIKACEKVIDQEYREIRKHVEKIGLQMGQKRELEARQLEIFMEGKNDE